MSASDLWAAERTGGVIAALTRHLQDSILLLGDDGRLRDVAGGLVASMGWQRADVVGRPALDFVHADERAEARQRLGLLIDDPQRSGRYPMELRLLRPDGTPVWVEAVVSNHLADPAIRAIVVNCRHIDGERHRADELRRSEQRLAATLADQHAVLAALAVNVPAAMFLLTPEGVVQYANQPFLGTPPAALEGHKLQSFLAPGDATRLAAALEHVRANAAPVQYQSTLRTAGREVMYEHRLSPVAPSGVVAAITLVSVDVTERRQLEQAVLEASSREQHKLGSDLHDGLGQELTGLSLLIGSLVRRVGREAPEFLADAEELHALVRGVMETTRAMARGLAPLSLREEGLPAALAQLGQQAGRHHGGPHVHFHLEDLPRSLLPVWRAEHLFRIAQEALNNAIKHGGGTRVDLFLQQGPRYVELRIEDDGRGVGVRKGQREAQGLGLKLMQYRADVLGAKLSIRRREEGGTRVRCLCPHGDT
jgi:two-component system, NarL family, sensor histidine kinase UhpB